MQKLNKNRSFFVFLTSVSVLSLVAAFGNPLEKLQVFKQTKFLPFNQTAEDIYIITENAKNEPYGFNFEEATEIAIVHENYQFQKLLFLGISALCAAIASQISTEVVDNAETEKEVKQVSNQAKKELLIDAAKNKIAMASFSQKQTFKADLQELSNLFGGDTTADASEANETDKFVTANYLMQEGHDIDTTVEMNWNCKKGTEEHARLKEKFQKWYDE